MVALALSAATARSGRLAAVSFKILFRDGGAPGTFVRAFVPAGLPPARRESLGQRFRRHGRRDPFRTGPPAPSPLFPPVRSARLRRAQGPPPWPVAPNGRAAPGFIPHRPRLGYAALVFKAILDNPARDNTQKPRGRWNSPWPRGRFSGHFSESRSPVGIGFPTGYFLSNGFKITIAMANPIAEPGTINGKSTVRPTSFPERRPDLSYAGHTLGSRS